MPKNKKPKRKSVAKAEKKKRIEFGLSQSEVDYRLKRFGTTLPGQNMTKREYSYYEPWT